MKKFWEMMNKTGKNILHLPGHYLSFLSTVHDV